MKSQPLTFKKPVKIIQLFRNINTYGKEEKSFEDRKEKIAWKPMQSTSGFVKDDVAHLPEVVLTDPNFASFDLIVLIDDNFQELQNVVYTKAQNLCFRKNSGNEVDFLQIKLNEKIELYLKHGYFEVGFPERDNFKLCEIAIHNPIAIKINGKRDFSLTGRRARTFVEQEYIFNYLGDFTKFEILKAPIIPILKTIPLERKVVDLMKTLW